MNNRIVFAVIVSIIMFFVAQTFLPFPYGLLMGIGGAITFLWFWFKKSPTRSGTKIKSKWIVVGVLSLIGIFLLGSGAAPLIFSEIAYGCNLQRILATGDLEQVSEHPITKAYHEKYDLDSTSTSRSRSLEWGYGTVEFSSYFRNIGEGWENAYLKITLDQCGIPQEFLFQCIDSEEQAFVSLNSKNDNVLEYLQNQNCFDMNR